MKRIINFVIAGAKHYTQPSPRRRPGSIAARTTSISRIKVVYKQQTPACAGVTAVLIIAIIFLTIATTPAAASCRMCVASTIAESCGTCACGGWTNHASNSCGVIEQRRSCSNVCGSRVERHTRTCPSTNCGNCSCGAVTCHAFLHPPNFTCVEERRTCSNACGHSRVERRTRTCTGDAIQCWWLNPNPPMSDWSGWSTVSGSCVNNTTFCNACGAWSAVSVVSGNCPATISVTNPAIAAGDCNVAGAILRLDSCNAGETMITGCDNRGGSGSSVRGTFTRYCQTPGHAEVRCD